MVEKRLDIRILKGLGERQEEISLWMIANKKGLFIGGALLLLSFLILSLFLFQGKENWSQARTEVEKNLAKIERLQTESPEELMALAKSIEGKFSVSSEFAPLYEGRLARALVQNGGVDEAIRLMKDQEGRLVSSLPTPFKIFSDSSLLIAQGNFESAWAMELLLKAELLTAEEVYGQEHWIQTLSAFNLVRRALLADILGKNEIANGLRQEILTRLQLKDQSKKEPLESIVEAYRIGQKNVISYLESHAQEKEQLANTAASSIDELLESVD